MPWRRSRSTMCSITGLPATGASGFGRRDVSGRKRDPSPPAISTPFIRPPSRRGTLTWFMLQAAVVALEIVARSRYACGASSDARHRPRDVRLRSISDKTSSSCTTAATERVSPRKRCDGGGEFVQRRPACRSAWRRRANGPPRRPRSRAPRGARRSARSAPPSGPRRLRAASVRRDRAPARSCRPMSSPVEPAGERRKIVRPGAASASARVGFGRRETRRLPSRSKRQRR